MTEGSAAVGREAATGIVLAGLLPLAGIVLLGWDPQAVMLVLWLEGLVMGFFLALRIYWRPPWRPGAMLVRLYAMLLVLLAWLSFVTSQLMGIMVIFSIAANGVEDDWTELWERLVEQTMDQWLWVPAIMLLLDQIWRFWREWVQPKRWLAVTIWPLLGALFGRVVLVQLVFLAGLAMLLFLEAPQAMVIFLIIVKTGLELVLLRRRKNRA
ncbi:MAG: hypothetical protein EA370_05850 [Wenzhouxiangella sp.]|nr:MAG: hypothetical protein EA370_05850 [Wenzhouxiangella sp.]